jgi:hypothetical protein
MEKKKRRRWIAGFLAVIMTITGVGIPLPFPSEASDIWPQKSTAPFYCLDGGKGWKKVDRYDMYKFDTMPSPLTETQAKRLFWAYPDNWSALKDAAKKFDPGLYAEIASTTSSANIVKYVKDDAGTKFAWVADNPEIEDRAIAAMEQASSVGLAAGKEAGERLQKIRQCHSRYCLFPTDRGHWIQNLCSERSLSAILQRSNLRVSGTMDRPGEMWAGWMPPRIKILQNL